MAQPMDIFRLWLAVDNTKPATGNPLKESESSLAVILHRHILRAKTEWIQHAIWFLDEPPVRQIMEFFKLLPKDLQEEGFTLRKTDIGFLLFFSGGRLAPEKAHDALTSAGIECVIIQVACDPGTEYLVEPGSFR